MDEEEMALSDRDLQQVGRYVQAHLIEWLPAPVLQLNERIVRVEEELKSQRELMQQGFAHVEKRLEQVDKRFEQMDKRFEDMNQRLIDMNNRLGDVNGRFSDMNSRFNGMMWFIGTGFVVLGTLMSLYAFFT